MSAGRQVEEQADVLIVTAVKDEWDAVLSVDTGAKHGSAWETRTGSTGPEVAYREFTTDTGVLRVAVVQAFGMGREQAVIAAAPLLERHPEIRCLAMCGVCAGRRGDVALGDVIVADRTWPYDAGKVKVSVDEQGHRSERFQGDMDLYRIHPPEWKQRAERFQPDPEAPWMKGRPRSYEEQGDWVLERLAKNDDPAMHPDRKAKCPDWAAVLEQLWKVKRLEDGEVKLTEEGSRHIRRRITLEPDGLRDPGPLKVIVGPIASGAPVVQDPTIYERLAETAGMRKVVGLEMETSAILALAYLRKVPFAVVMKGVMDHADAFKSDNMKSFATKASAECLIAFLRQNLPPRSEEGRSATMVEGGGSGGRAAAARFSAIVVEGFKSFRERHVVELAPLTIIVGPNSSGKSSLFQTLLLLRQTLEARETLDPLRIAGPLVQLSSHKELFWRAPDGTKATEFTVGIKRYDLAVETTFREGPHGLALAKTILVRNGHVSRFFPDMSHDEILQVLENGPLPMLDAPRGVGDRYSTEVVGFDVCIWRSTPDGERRQFLAPWSKFFRDLILGITHVPTFRGSPERRYQHVPTEGSGASGRVELRHAVSQIYAWQRRGDERINKLNRQLAECGLTSSVGVRQIDGTELELRVGRLPADSPLRGEEDYINITSVGFGVSQTLPVLTALLAAHEGQIVIIEEPEQHLHPRAVQGIADAMAEAAMRGVTVISENHSALLLSAVMRSNVLAPEYTRIHSFGRDAEGATRVQTMSPLDEVPRSKTWPSSLFFAESDWRSEP
jgi:nucleoside phosphorylase